MKEINIAGLAVILVFILFIANKKNKLLTDYLLIGINGWICVYLILKSNRQTPIHL